MMSEMTTETKLKQALVDCGNNAGSYLTMATSVDFLMQVPDEVKLVVEEFKSELKESKKENTSIKLWTKRMLKNYDVDDQEWFDSFRKILEDDYLNDFDESLALEELSK